MEVDISNTAGSQELTDVRPNESVGSVIEGIDKVKPEGADSFDEMRAKIAELQSRNDALQKRLEMPFGEKVKLQEEKIRNRPGIGEMFKKVGEAIKRFEEKSKNASIHVEAVVTVAGQEGVDKAKQGLDKVRDPEWRGEQYKKVDKALKDAKERAEKRREESRMKFWDGVGRKFEEAGKWVEDTGQEMVQDVKDVAEGALKIAAKEVIAPLVEGALVPSVGLVGRVDREFSRIQNNIAETAGFSLQKAMYDVLNAPESMKQAVNSELQDHPNVRVFTEKLTEMIKGFIENDVERKGIAKFFDQIHSLKTKCKAEVVNLMNDGASLRRSAEQIRSEFEVRRNDRDSLLKKVATAVSNSTS